MLNRSCAANFIKHGQHCVAGKCVNTGKWIRPVSNQQGAELSHEQATPKLMVFME